MGGRVGYEYRYSFWKENQIISLYKFSLPLPLGLKSSLFEIRTNFILKRSPDEGGAESIIDSERYDACMDENEKRFVGYRLKEYWMTDGEANKLIHEAIDFATQLVVDPQYAALEVIPVVVGLDVCTVQQEGESLGTTMDRAIRAQNLVPLYLWSIEMEIKQKPMMDSMLMDHLRELLRIRVENVDQGMSLMQACPICLRNPSIGAQISSLHCNHAFHSHCIVRWLENSNLCPVCQSEAYDIDF